MKEYFTKKLIALLDAVAEKGTAAAMDDAERLADSVYMMTGGDAGLTGYEQTAILGIIDGILYDGSNPDSIETALNYIFN